MARKTKRTTSKRVYAGKRKRSFQKTAKPKSKLPLKSFKQAIGNRFQTKETGSHVESGKKSKAKGRREGL